MSVIRREGERILHGERGDPNIVFRYRPAFHFEAVLDFAVSFGRVHIAGQYRIVLSEFFDARDVLLNVMRFMGAEVQLSDDD